MPKNRYQQIQQSAKYSISGIKAKESIMDIPAINLLLLTKNNL